MKKLLTLFFLFAGTVSAQVDSSLTKINANIQARDLEYLGGSVLSQNDGTYEDLYDAAKKKFRVSNTPANNTSVAVDSVTVGVWLSVATALRRDYIAVLGGVFSRVDAVLRAKNNVWLTAKLDAGEAHDQQTYANRRNAGRTKLSRK